MRGEVAGDKECMTTAAMTYDDSEDDENDDDESADHTQDGNYHHGDG